MQPGEADADSGEGSDDAGSSAVRLDSVKSFSFDHALESGDGLTLCWVDGETAA